MFLSSLRKNCSSPTEHGADYCELLHRRRGRSADAPAPFNMFSSATTERHRIKQPTTSAASRISSDVPPGFNYIQPRLSRALSPCRGRDLNNESRHKRLNMFSPPYTRNMVSHGAYRSAASIAQGVGQIVRRQPGALCKGPIAAMPFRLSFFVSSAELK